ncbi:MAG: hypothetical protein ACD_58C00243G0002 [uncultured bacterium]|nr:MAG: hypothetical protein ACD_58C00243G0002 [uncultured bacterium]
MQIIIKGNKGFDVFEDNKQYIEDKFRKFEKRVKEPATLEFNFLHTHASKAGIDKRIHLTFIMPGMTKPEHLEELSEHFKETIDLLQKRFDKFLLRKREKKIDGARKPKKYLVADKLNRDTEK